VQAKKDDMKKVIFFALYIVLIGKVYSQNYIVNDSIKLQMFMDSYENLSTSANFIVFKAVNFGKKEIREICTLGGNYIYRIINNENISTVDINKQLFEVKNFVFNDTLVYQRFDSAILKFVDRNDIRKIELPVFDSIKYNYIDSAYGKILIEKAILIDKLEKEWLDLGFSESKKMLRDSLDACINENYKFIRKLYRDYKFLLPQYYFNHGISTRLGCYAGEFLIDEIYNKKKASP
jgi:hypothetical protein